MVRPLSSEGLQRQRQFWTVASLISVSALVITLVLAAQQLLLQRRLPVAPPAAGPQAPAPPAQATWVSPLRRQCGAGDPGLQRRLRRLQAALPRQRQHLRIDPSNYGPRVARDAFGHPVPNTPQMVVLHETVYGLSSAINTFITHHPDDADQVSYHMLIGEKGQIVQTLDPARRAYGAGYSAFQGRWAVTNPAMAGSVNNFALHVSLETPIDGEDNEPSHSGYSTAQYDALAVVLADWMGRFGIAPNHITTHRHVDLGLERADPRSFDWQALQVRLAALGLLC